MNQERSTPFFSIIVPVYNVEMFIDCCVNSILQQTFGDFELIIVDDGSTDSSAHICDMYSEKDSRLFVIHKENGGLVSARKTGAHHAKGKYIISVDGDDYIEKNALWDLYNVIKDADYDVVCYSYNHVDGFNNVIETKRIHEGELCGTDVYSHMLYNEALPFFSMGCDPSVCLKAIRREKYVSFQLRVPDEITMGEDLAVSLPVIEHSNSLYFFNKPLYNYRVNEKSITATFRAKDIDNLKILIRYFSETCNFESVHMKSQIAAYTIFRIFQIIVQRCKVLNSYRKFKVTYKEIDKYLLNIISNYKYNFKNLKGIVIPFLIRHRMLAIMWLFYHR